MRGGKRRHKKKKLDKMDEVSEASHEESELGMDEEDQGDIQKIVGVKIPQFFTIK